MNLLLKICRKWRFRDIRFIFWEPAIYHPRCLIFKPLYNPRIPLARWMLLDTTSYKYWNYRDGELWEDYNWKTDLDDLERDSDYD
jgi:hypothetical protein